MITRAAELETPNSKSAMSLALAQALTAARSRAGLSRASLARLARIDRSVLSRLETATYPHQLTTTTLDNLTQALDCGDALYVAVGMAAPTTLSLVTDPELHQAFTDTRAAREALRRLHLQVLAIPFARLALTPDGR